MAVVQCGDIIIIIIIIVVVVVVVVIFVMFIKQKGLKLWGHYGVEIH